MAIDARHFFAISSTGGLITSSISHLISNLRSFLDLPSEFDPERIYRKGEAMQIVTSKRRYHPWIALLVCPLTATVFPQVPFVFFFFLQDWFLGGASRSLMFGGMFPPYLPESFSGTPGLRLGS